MITSGGPSRKFRLLPALRADGTRVTISVAKSLGHLNRGAIRIRSEGAGRCRMRFEDERLALCACDQNVRVWVCHVTSSSLLDPA